VLVRCYPLRFTFIVKKQQLISIPDSRVSQSRVT
jgi:hypothetical protein